MWSSIPISSTAAEVTEPGIVAAFAVEAVFAVAERVVEVRVAEGSGSVAEGSGSVAEGSG